VSLILFSLSLSLALSAQALFGELAYPSFSASLPHPGVKGTNNGLDARIKPSRSRVSGSSNSKSAASLDKSVRGLIARIDHSLAEGQATNGGDKAPEKEKVEISLSPELPQACLAAAAVSPEQCAVFGCEPCVLCASVKQGSAASSLGVVLSDHRFEAGSHNQLRSEPTDSTDGRSVAHIAEPYSSPACPRELGGADESDRVDLKVMTSAGKTLTLRMR
jgi:hypothetical protein